MSFIALVGLAVYLLGFVCLAALLYVELCRAERNGMYPPSALLVVGLLIAALAWPVSLVVGSVALLAYLGTLKVLEVLR